MVLVFEAALTRQVLGVKRERQASDHDFMEFESVLESSSLEIPDDDVGLEAHEGLLATRDIFAVVGDSDN